MKASKNRTNRAIVRSFLVGERLEGALYLHKMMIVLYHVQVDHNFDHFDYQKLEDKVRDLTRQIFGMKNHKTYSFFIPGDCP